MLVYHGVRDRDMNIVPHENIAIFLYPLAAP